MTRVFIGGSRRVTRLGAEVRRRLDNIVAKEFAIVIGDANGADRAVQQYLKSVGYANVEVFCTNGVCRNNLGGWATRAVVAPQGTRNFSYYAVKDEQMANEASLGFMIWDGKSKGTLANVQRLVGRQKRVLLYVVPDKQFITIGSKRDLDHFLSRGSGQQRRKTMQSTRQHTAASPQVSLF